MVIPALRDRLSRAPEALVVIFAMTAAFCCYFSMYAFRKPFTAGTFGGDEASFLGTGVGLKTAYVLSQILGYMLSKYVGIKVCSEARWDRRAWLLILLIAWAHVALLLFAVLPMQWRVVALFANGLPLGMVWGLVVGFLEGRRTSELLLAGLSCSFIMASGIVKDVGRALMDGAETLTVFALDLPGSGTFGVELPNLLSGFGRISEVWMPFATGVVFLPAFVLSVLALAQLPRPTSEDERLRVHRDPMDHARRMAFVREFLPGLVLLFVTYFFLTAFRDFRDTYQVEMFTELGLTAERGIFSRSETWVALGVTGALGLLFLIKSNRWALITVFALMAGGLLTMGGATLLLERGAISGLAWMIAVGVGAYLAYVPFGSMLFDRIIASTGVVGTAVFAIYVADALGYTGSVAMQLYRDLGHGDSSRLDFFKGFTYVLSIGGAALLIAAGAYFATRRRPADRGDKA